MRSIYMNAESVSKDCSLSSEMVSKALQTHFPRMR